MDLVSSEDNKIIKKIRAKTNKIGELKETLAAIKGQYHLMKYDPASGEKAPYPSHAGQWREWHGRTAWIWNPWTSIMRDPRDIGSDPFGHLIQPPQKETARGQQA